MLIDSLEKIKLFAGEFGEKFPASYDEAYLWLKEQHDREELSEESLEKVLEIYFMLDVPGLEEVNREVREPGTRWTESLYNWPNHYFVIGDDLCGGYYYIDLAGRELGESVGYYDHEIPEFRNTGLTVREYLEEWV